MLRVFVLLAVLATAAHGHVLRSVSLLDGRIVGGEDTDIQKYLHQVSVRLIGSHTCGGSILSDKVVVTAAHCFMPLIPAIFYSIQYGQTNLGSSANIIGAWEVVIHKKYNSKTHDYDVALILLAGHIPFGSSALPIALASQEPAPGTIATVTGWGTTSEGGSSSQKLQAVEVEITPRSYCNDQYDQINTITDNMICAAASDGRGGKDACQGDSGGPLVANGKLVGVVSWGVGCARPNYPGVYSNVAALASWIAANTPEAL